KEEGGRKGEGSVEGGKKRQIEVEDLKGSAESWLRSSIAERQTLHLVSLQQHSQCDAAVCERSVD
ncbi:Hypothetical predicted protein, partial [Scomber scombrus]